MKPSVILLLILLAVAALIASATFYCGFLIARG